MKLPSPLALMVAAACAAGALLVTSARAEDTTIVAPVTRIELAADGKSAKATLKDEKSGEVTVTITDDLTLDKFKDKRIQEGDEIRARFDRKDGRNSSKSFKKTAGC
ncbi:MAG TPA: hypothetical protein VFP44_04985 [Usitatibacter sp.]|nr:hypothetical protein [Usitatibacter sp.]